MRKIIAAINMTLDGYCDHTAGIVNDDTMEHYNELLRNSGTLAYGRTTYQMMESYWPALVQSPSGNGAMDTFAGLIDEIPKIVFSHTLREVSWKHARVAAQSLQDEVAALKRQEGKDILIGSPSLIAQATKQGLVDEYQLCVHPVILGKGLLLFKDISREVDLELTGTRALKGGPIVLYYKAK